MSFASRQDAGQQLAQGLLANGISFDTVIGLPRGGVIVAAEVAQKLARPLKILVVRKIGHPEKREFAVGALAENDVVVLDDFSINANDTVHAKLAPVIQEEKASLQRYQQLFQQTKPGDYSGQTVLLVDDGLATGATMEAAVLAARKYGAQKIRVAVPVASRASVLRLERIADAVFATIVDPGFQAVGAYYKSFPQVDDEEVLRALEASGRPRYE